MESRSPIEVAKNLHKLIDFNEVIERPMETERTGLARTAGDAKH